MLALVLVCAAGCEQSSGLERQLREKYPEYFDLGTFKGLEVYVWQMAENSYYCGVLAGTNRLKTPEELWNLKGASIGEMQAILATYDIPEKSIFIIPCIQPYSSYYYEIDAEYCERVRALFFGESD